MADCSCNLYMGGIEKQTHRQTKKPVLAHYRAEFSEISMSQKNGRKSAHL